MNGIVLRTIFYKDASKLIYLYTNQGIKTFIARNVLSMKSPLSVLSDAFKRVDLTVKDTPLASVEDVKVLDYYLETKKSYEKTILVHLMAEIILKNFTDDDDHQKGYSLLVKVLDQMEKSPYPFMYYLMFSLKSLYLLGFGLKISRCHHCDLNASYYDPFTLEALCETHGKNELNEKTYQLVTKLLKEDASLFEANPLDKSMMMTYFIMSMRLFETHLDFIPKSKEIILSYLKERP